MDVDFSSLRFVPVSVVFNEARSLSASFAVSVSSGFSFVEVVVVTVALGGEEEGAGLEADDDCSGEEACPCLEVSDGALDVATVALPLSSSERLEVEVSWIGEPEALS